MRATMECTGAMLAATLGTSAAAVVVSMVVDKSVAPMKVRSCMGVSRRWVGI